MGLAVGGVSLQARSIKVGRRSIPVERLMAALLVQRRPSKNAAPLEDLRGRRAGLIADDLIPRHACFVLNHLGISIASAARRNDEAGMRRTET